MSTKKVITFDGEPQDIFVHLEVGDFFVKPPYFVKYLTFCFRTRIMINCVFHKLKKKMKQASL